MGSENSGARIIRRHILVGLATCLLFLGMVGAWAVETEIAGAVIAPGLVVVDTNVKKVQHPTGGIIRELLVVNGDRVESGEIVARLDATQASANLAILTKRLDELLARQAREEAERDGLNEIVFPSELTDRTGDPEIALLLAGQERLFQIRQKARAGQRAQLVERIAQLQQEIAGYRAQQSAKTREVEWIRKELDGITTLWEKRLVQITRVVNLQRDVARAEGELAHLVAAQAQAKDKITETEPQILQIDQELRAEVGKDLAGIRAEIAETAEKRIAAEDVLTRTDIRAPQDGIVHEMSVHTVGGVVAPGEVLMQVVPANDSLDIEAKIAPEMIDQVRVGQKAALRFSAFDLRTTPEVEGLVTTISADLVQDPKTNQHFYSVRIAVSEAQLSTLELHLLPGMPVECFIKSDERTVLSYLTKPLVDQMKKAFRER